MHERHFEDIIKANLQEMQSILDAFASDPLTVERISAAAGIITESYKSGGKIIACGNGGSMSDAMHLCEELTARFRHDRRALPAMAVSDPAYLSCAANDFGYENVFSRYVEAFGAPGDVLVAISTSGTSANIMKAAAAARERGMKVVSLTGRRSSAPVKPAPGHWLPELADVDICTPASEYADRVQELHIKVIHTLVQLVEAGLDLQ